MFTATLGKSLPKRQVIPMNEMEPGEIGVVVSNDSVIDGFWDNTIVMRTTSTDVHEVLNLSCPKANSHWKHKATLPVRLLMPGEQVILEGV